MMMSKAIVSVIKTTPTNVINDYSRLMNMVDYKGHLSTEIDILIKLNLSWTLYYPSCSSQPWQVEGVVKTLLSDGFKKERLFPVENKTVVTNPRQGAVNNKWLPILDRYGLTFCPLTEVEWIKYSFKQRLLMLDKIFPEGIEIPKIFIGKNIIHLPTLKTHGHSITTGAIKNAFGGLLKEVRHYAHKYIHEVLVDLMIMQKELHPSVFAVMDGTICGDGAGPRTMIPLVKNYILASTDSVAIDAIAAKMMGYEPMKIPYIQICHDMGLGVGDPAKIKVVGEDISGVNFRFTTKRSVVIWGDQCIRKGHLQAFEYILLHTPLVIWASWASTLYHDFLWYPVIGRARIKRFMLTEWGGLFQQY